MKGFIDARVAPGPDAAGLALLSAGVARDSRRRNQERALERDRHRPGGDARLEELWRDHLINVVYAVTPKSESCVVTRFVGALREADLYDSAPTRRTEPVDASLS